VDISASEVPAEALPGVGVGYGTQERSQTDLPPLVEQDSAYNSKLMPFSPCPHGAGLRISACLLMHDLTQRRVDLH